MYIFFKSIITHAHQQVIFSYEVLLYTKRKKKKIGAQIGNNSLKITINYTYPVKTTPSRVRSMIFLSEYIQPKQ